MYLLWVYAQQIHLCLKQVQISVNGVRKINTVKRENKIIFLTLLADIFYCFKHTHTHIRKQD